MSCGCYRRKRMGGLTARHGQSRTPEHQAWRAMRHRCMSPRNTNWLNYGGRGITVCPEWTSFERFYSDMGPRPSPQHSLDRRDNNGPYSPENCRWVLAETQMRNRRSNSLLTYNRVTHTITEWAARLATTVPTIRGRLARGWSIEDTLATPVKAYKPRGRLKEP